MEKFKSMSIKEADNIMQDYALKTGKIKDGEYYYYTPSELRKVLLKVMPLHK